MGPNAPFGHGSVFTLSEHIARYLTTIISKCQTEGIKAIVPSQAAVDDYFAHITAFMPRTAWAAPCRSWFKQGRTDGQAAIYPGSRLSFLHLMEQPRYEDFGIEYWDDNVFAFLGNGFDTREFDGRDITNYLGLLDEKVDKQPEYGEELVQKLAGWAVGK